MPDHQRPRGPVEYSPAQLSLAIAILNTPNLEAKQINTLLCAEDAIITSSDGKENALPLEDAVALVERNGVSTHRDVFPSSEHESKGDSILATQAEPNLLNTPMDLSYQAAFKNMLAMSAPFMAGQLISFTGDYINTIIASRSDNAGLAASGLFFPTQLFLTYAPYGILTATGIIISLTRSKPDVGRILDQSLLAGSLLSVPAMALMGSSSRIFLHLKQDPTLCKIVKSYFNVYLASVAPRFWLYSQHQFVISTNNGVAYLTSQISITGVKLITTYLLAFGKFNLPKLGVVALAWGELFSVGLNFVGFTIYLRFNKKFVPFELFKFHLRSTLNILKDIFKLGFPLLLQYSTELAVLVVMALISGILGDDNLSAMRIVTQYAGLNVAVLIALEESLGILAAPQIQNRHYNNVKRLFTSAMGIGLSANTILLVLYKAIPDHLMSPFLDVHDPKNARTIEISRSIFLTLGLIYEFPELIRLIVGGLLLGFNNSTISMAASMVNMLVIGNVLGYALSIPLGYGSNGLFAGEAIGYSAAALSVLLVYPKVKELIATRVDKPTVSNSWFSSKLSFFGFGSRSEPPIAASATQFFNHPQIEEESEVINNRGQPSLEPTNLNNIPEFDVTDEEDLDRRCCVIL